MPVGLDGRLAERIVGTAMCRLRPTPGNKILCTKGQLKQVILAASEEAHEIGFLAGQKEQYAEITRPGSPDRPAWMDIRLDDPDELARNRIRLRTAVIRTLMLTEPSPRASRATRQALTVVLVKPGRGSSSYVTALGPFGVAVASGAAVMYHDGIAFAISRSPVSRSPASTSRIAEIDRESKCHQSSFPDAGLSETPVSSPWGCRLS